MLNILIRKKDTLSGKDMKQTIKKFIYQWIEKQFMDGCSHYNSLSVRKSCRSKQQARKIFNLLNIPHANGKVFFNPFKALDFEFVKDIQPGEAVFIDRKNNLHTKQIVSADRFSPCIFEWVYLAAPDSMLDGVSVYKSRIRMGEALADQIIESGIQIDSVIPVPDTGRPMATGLADKLKVRYREGFVKNRYIGRTFIMPGQQVRKRSLQFKLHPIDLEFKNNSVLIVDDSIVRGNTSKKIVEIARNAGAKNVYFASASPQIVSPDPYGIDLPTTSELIAANSSIEEIRKFIGADGLFYNTIENIREAIQIGNNDINKFSDGCFTKKYPTPEITSEMLEELGNDRNRTRTSYLSEGTDEEGENYRNMSLV